MGNILVRNRHDDIVDEFKRRARQPQINMALACDVQHAALAETFDRQLVTADRKLVFSLEGTGFAGRMRCLAGG